MPQHHPSPHHLALFSLEPLNDRARALLDHPGNRDHASDFVTADGERAVGIDVGLHFDIGSRHTLATLGRNGANITLEGANISRIQHSFEIHQVSGAVLL